MMNVDEEIVTLQKKIIELGHKDSNDGRYKVQYGVLFKQTEDIFEAIMGTLKAAKKRKIITFEGELLLQGVHDKVEIVLLVEPTH